MENQEKQRAEGIAWFTWARTWYQAVVIATREGSARRWWRGCVHRSPLRLALSLWPSETTSAQEKAGEGHWIEEVRAVPGVALIYKWWVVGGVTERKTMKGEAIFVSTSVCDARYRWEYCLIQWVDSSILSASNARRRSWLLLPNP